MNKRLFKIDLNKRQFERAEHFGKKKGKKFCSSLMNEYGIKLITIFQNKFSLLGEGEG